MRGWGRGEENSRCLPVRRRPIYQKRRRQHTVHPLVPTREHSLSPQDALDKSNTHRVHGIHKLRNLIIVVVVRLHSIGTKSASVALLRLVRLGNLAQALDRLGTKLVEDPGNELGELLLDSGTVDRVDVGSDSGVDCAWSAGSAGVVARGRMVEGGWKEGKLTLGSGKVDHVAVVLEHVDLLDTYKDARERSSQHPVPPSALIPVSCLSRPRKNESSPAMAWTLSFLSAPWSFLSSPCPAGRGRAMTFLRGVPLPPGRRRGRQQGVHRFRGLVRRRAPMRRAPEAA